MTPVKERSRNSDELIESSEASRAQLDATVARLRAFVLALEAEVLHDQDGDDLPCQREPGDGS